MVKIMELKKYKDNNYRRKSYALLVIGFLLLSISSYLFYKSYALYEVKKDFDVINGTVEDPGDLYFAYYVNNTITREMPNKDSGLTLDTTKSSCTSGVTISWDDNWHAILDYSTYESNSTTRTKCTLYFTKKIVAGKDVLTYVKKNAPSSTTDVYTVPDKTSDTCTYTLAYDGTSDNNLRYVGANPCNYVTFNGEQAGWRIIGILNTPEGQRIKLIRTDSIGSYSWDNAYFETRYGSNDWRSSAIGAVLNSGAYYNKTSGTCPSGADEAITSCDFTSNGLTEAAKNQIDMITWKLGGTQNFTSSSNGLVSHWYTYERGTTVHLDNPTEFKDRVGLIYPSDYGYATSGGSTSNRTSCLNKELSNWNDSAYSDCKNNAWLYSSRGQWTLTPSSTNSFNVFKVAGSVAIAKAAVRAEVRPSVYLKSSTMILDGEGTPENPYQIG